MAHYQMFLSREYAKSLSSEYGKSKDYSASYQLTGRKCNPRFSAIKISYRMQSGLNKTRQVQYVE